MNYVFNHLKHTAMFTSRNLALALSTLCFYTLISCSSNEDAIQLTPIERTDISIQGDMQLESFQQNTNGEAGTDLVSFVYYGIPSDRFDYIVQISSDLKLIIKIYDGINQNPWVQVGQPYNIYPGQDLEDKLQYAKVEIRTSSNEPRYTSNDGNVLPQGALLDVFQVVQNDGAYIQCRIRDMELFHQVHPERSITINGTFIGALDF